MNQIRTFLLLPIILAFFYPAFLFSSESKANSNEAGNTLYLMSATIMSEVGAEQAGNIIQKTDKIRIINLGPVINHEGVDYAPTVSADGRTLFYVSNRPGSRVNDNENVNSHDFWAARKNNRLDTVFFEPWNIDTLVGLDYLNVNSEFNEGAASIAADRQSLYFTACSRPDGLGECDIYSSEIQGNVWSRPVNLGPNVNSKGWDAQPSIAPDKSRIYFVSSREGPNSDGKSKPQNIDIWYSDWDDDMEEWLPAINLEAINTDDQEFTPFIAADNATLFFASRGHKPNIGGLDFYVTRYDAGSDSWSTPENLGAPINTKEDEMFISLPASGDVIYFSSKRKDLKGYQGDLDVFMAFVPTFFRAVNLIGTVVDECSGEFIPADIVVKNPITGREVKDKIDFNKEQFEVVISNTDYGDPKDSIKFVDIEITATNPKYGTTSLVKRIEKPDVTEEIEETKEFASEIKVKLVLGQKPVIQADIAEADYITRIKPFKPELGTYRGLVMNETKTWDLYPLLPNIFYEIGDGNIPPRYQLFKSKEQTKFFTDTTIAGGTLDKYYHLLNIYGFRLQNHPNEKITIVGNTDNTNEGEKSKELAQLRAQNVFNYLRDIWGISEDRMKIEARLLPKTPSGTQQDPDLGQAENRRVDIECDEWEIIKPVFDVGSVIRPQPETMNFNVKNGIEEGIIAKRRIEIKRGESVWNTITDLGEVTKSEINWNWQNTDYDYPTDEVPFTAQFIVTTKEGHECESDPIEIPVMQVSSERKQVEKTADSTMERYNLILFPFNSAEAGPLNQRIMSDYVYQRCRPTSKIEVIGHTDVKGMYDTNKKLSVRRAGTVETGINRTTKGKFGFLKSDGVGEEDPLYPNELPEGRFYNRTVQVIIQTPVEEYE